MKIDIEILRRDLAIIVYRPSWWRRLLFGDKQRESFVYRWPAIPERYVWLFDSSGTPVETELQIVLERNSALAPHRISIR